MVDGVVSWFAGVDWGSERHHVCLLDAAGQVVGERAFRHGGAGLAALCDWLVSVAGEPSRVAVAIEVPHGPVADTLLDRGFAVHAINPKQLERLRDRVSLAGAKDDRRDARVAAGGLRTDPHLFRPVEAGDPAVIALREWSRLAEELQHERVRLGNRIRQQLWRYYPQLLAVIDDVTAEWVLDLWTLAPTPTKAARLREATLARLLQEHRIRRVDAERALGILRQPAITVAEGVTEAAVLHLRSLVARLRLANREFHQAERKLDELCATLREKTAAAGGAPRDAAILSSLPGVGPVTLAALLSEAAGPISRRDYAALRTLPSGPFPQDPFWRGSCDQAQRQELHCHDALRGPSPAAQRYVPLGASGGAERPQVPPPLHGPAGAWPILRPCLARCRRPAAWGRLRPATAAGAVRPRARHADSAVGQSDPLVRPELTSLHPDQPSAERRAQALSRRPRTILDRESTVLRSTGREGALHANAQSTSPSIGA
jgi:transposase